MTGSLPAGPVLETERLRLHLLSADSADDAAFMLRMLNDPSFIQNIGDRGVRVLAQARDYLRERPVNSYVQHGYGMYRVEVKASGATAGHCGLVRREGLEGPDLGYAFVPEFRSQGYAAESAAGVLAYAREKLGLGRILAIVNPDNASSIRVLQKLGFRFERMVQLSEDDIAVKLFVSEAES